MEPASASQRPGCSTTDAVAQARAFRIPQRSGRELARAVAGVRRALEWHDDLDEAAAAALRRGVPIVWIQALGSLGGFL